MNNKFRKLILPVSILAAMQSFALGLGGLQVESNLNEALKGKIPLILNEDEDSDKIKVSLASEKDYKRVGLDRSFVPSNIKVSLVDEEGEKFIKVYSNGPISEPIVSLLVVVDWANGHLLREFTLLLDPPLFNSTFTNDSYTKPVQTKKYEAPIKIEETDSQNDSTSQVDYSNTISESSNNGSQQLTVESGDTLWRIASRHSGGGSTQQAMVAIFNNNPSAFQNNDMNFLKKGAVLSIPDSNQISSISNSQAISEVSAQTSQWSQLQSQSNDSKSSTSTDVDYGIELVPPSDDDSSNYAEGSSNASNNDTKLTTELSQVKEQLASTTLESDDLSSRVQELEGIVEDQGLALSLKDSDLAQLQQQIATDSDGLDDDVWNEDQVAPDDEMIPSDEMAPSDEMLPDDEMIPSDEMAPSDEMLPDDEMIPSDEMTPSDEIVTTDDKTPKVSSIAPSSVTEKSFIDKILGFKSVLIGLGGLLLAIIGFFFFKNRNKDEDSDGESFLDSIVEKDSSASSLEKGSGAIEGIDNSEQELSLNDNDLNLNDELTDKAESNLATLEEEVELAVDELVIEDEPGVVVMDDEIDLDLDDMEIDDFTETIGLDADASDENLDEDLSIDLEFGLDESSDEELEITNIEESDVSEELQFDLGDDGLSLDNIDSTGDEELNLSIDDSIQPTVDESDEIIESAVSGDDFDIGLDLDDVVDDAVDTKLDLARAYFEMGDVDGAKQMVNEVIEEGTKEQMSKAQILKTEIESS